MLTQLKNKDVLFQFEDIKDNLSNGGSVAWTTLKWNQLLWVVCCLVVSSFVEAGNVLETRDEYFVHC